MKKLGVSLILGVLFSCVVLMVYAQDPAYTERVLVDQSNATLGMKISPDGSKLILGSGPVLVGWREGGRPNGRNEITVLDLETGDVLQQIESFAMIIGDVGLNADGTQIIAARASDKVGIWDMETGELLREYRGISSAVMDASKDGRFVISNASRANPILWDFETGEIIHKFKEKTGDYGPAAFSPDSTLMAVMVAESEANSLILWDTETNSEIYRMEDLPSVVDLEFSPDGQMLALGTLGSGVRLISTATGDIAYEFTDYETADGEISSIAGGLAFSADGEQLLAVFNRTDLSMWEIETGEYTYVGSHQAPIFRVIFSADGDPITSSYDGFVKMWVKND